jgi:hypothetical protein
MVPQPSLVHLDLDGTAVTGRPLSLLVRHRKLRCLNLRGTDLDDKALLRTNVPPASRKALEANRRPGGST